MAQSGSALDWGSRGHRFKSCCPDHWARLVIACWLAVLDEVLIELRRLTDDLNVEFKRALDY